MHPDLINFLAYPIAKFIAYSAWCAVGLWLLVPKQTGGVRFMGLTLWFGAFRWLLGLGFGLMVFIALGSISSESVAAWYFGIYTPLRIVEWTIIAAVIMRKLPAAVRTAQYPRAALWIGGGIVVSFLTDVVSPQGLAGKFCVGRCLC